MSLLAPLGLLFGLLALPILVLYMLRLRRKEVLVSSTLLWQRLLRDRQANTPWQKLRRNLLLFVQLLLLALLVLALARPAVPTPMVASGSVVVLLDASASMSATDVPPTRFAAASETAAHLLDGLSDGAILAVIRVDDQPELLAQAHGASPAEKQAARRALEAAQPGAAPADWEAAFELAAATAANWQTPETTFVILSDGGLPGQGLPALPGTVRYLPVGVTDHNLAISAFSLRQIRPSSLQPELFARATNYGSRQQEAVLSIYLDNALLSAELLRLEAGESRSLSLNDLPARAGIYRADLRGKEAADNLSLDDQAFAVYNPSQERRVLVASEEYFAQPAGTNIFLEQILAALPSITPYRVSTEEGAQAGTGFQIPDPASDPFDLYIFDGVLPTNPQTGVSELPGGNLLLISPPDNPLLEQHGTFTPTLEVEVSDHSLLQGLDWNWNKIYVAQARQIWLPAWGEAVLKDKGGMLLFIGQTGGRRVAVLTFDLNDSDLPLKVAFPLLFSRLVDYLIPPQGTAAPDGLAPGEPLEIRYDPMHTIVEVISPGGKVLSPRLTETGGWFSQTQEQGLYTVRYIIPGTGGKMRREPDHFAVNLFDPLESRIAPAAAIQVGRSSLPPARAVAVSQRELWRLPAALALGVLGMEWWLYHRPSFHLTLRRKDRPTP